ncbi:uncharacterized protein PAE49_005853 [Odontesthes bonariensis]|uniref:uncharacterized protein LOC142380894 n=1 Tax=Odontesthes bonariensis TaxID=219752 RepID=UPI003F583D7F
MSISAVKDKGLTLVTMAIDNKSLLPPLCEMVRALCSPACCSVNKAMMGRSAAGALGTVQIMVGLFSIGLGPGRTSTHPGDLTNLGAAYWLGAVFIAAGIVSVLANTCPSACMVGFAVFMNAAGSIFAVVGIVLYAVDLSGSSIVWMCDNGRAAAPDFGDNCIYVAYFAQRLLGGMDVTLIVLLVLQLCVCISLLVLGIRALCCRRKETQTHSPHKTAVTEVEVVSHHV